MSEIVFSKIQLFAGEAKRIFNTFFTVWLLFVTVGQSRVGLSSKIFRCTLGLGDVYMGKETLLPQIELSVLGPINELV